MMAVRIHYNMKRAVVRAIEAGNDIVMLGLPYNKVDKIINYVIKQVRKGKLSEELVNQKVDKIIKYKEKYNITDEKVTGFNIEEINNQIKNIREKVMK